MHKVILEESLQKLNEQEMNEADFGTSRTEIRDKGTASGYNMTFRIRPLLGCTGIPESAYELISKVKLGHRIDFYKYKLSMADGQIFAEYPLDSLLLEVNVNSGYHTTNIELHNRFKQEAQEKLDTLVSILEDSNWEIIDE